VLRSLRRTAFCAPPACDLLAQPVRAGWETKGDSGLKGRDGWGRGVRPCSSPVADFQPAASATPTNPALTSWAKEYRAVGPGTGRFAQSLLKRPFKRLSGQGFRALGPLQSSLFPPSQNVEEPKMILNPAVQTQEMVRFTMKFMKDMNGQRNRRLRKLARNFTQKGKTRGAREHA